MNRKIITTNDGSVTIHIEDWNESYHSKHGAIQEAYHVFIKNGLDLFSEEAAILEIGFGTGLNAFITYLEHNKRKLKINYVGVEAYPVSVEEISQLNYVSQLDADQYKTIFDRMHESAWDKPTTIDETFSLTKRQQFFQDIKDENTFDLIYFDAFGFRVQPELWDEAIFEKMFKALKPNGILVTYACRTSIKKAMLASGFKVEKLPGAPGKREMLRALK
ncbi:tRNA (5-methylaminomethyl-2-thiouridine)(34)-methyltransferase MnmD [Flavobacterium sp. NRK F10]|uniref:tRNA (5-methylaminomethyl-2-thiouridine)(34)-methyltransferase MnmD n=1 Tax=Flavobacterium sp. NRK F10 TaxID=2954931 RepID=UPI00209064AA|nr:tRNA (5-methylaminomethyl-2-thiouridine)(34)-methyltransferase MnmD [Flavobacterium sp. NRK F10]MCO6173501.1 tRNA (5-methylaminomethyl-2-thiouridine)(34)-methyltransferase MnmD [Flavobacterium sp. NRK F10]